MEIILLQDMRQLGRRGDVVKVKPGYARNYLLPQGMALEKNRANLAYFAQQKKKIDAVHAKARDEALEIAAELAKLKIVIRKRVGETETLYGSVTVADVAEKLAAKGVTVDKRKIDLGVAHGIKTLGAHTVTVDLHPEVMAPFTVTVEAENAEELAAARAAAAEAAARADAGPYDDYGSAPETSEPVEAEPAPVPAEPADADEPAEHPPADDAPAVV